MDAKSIKQPLPKGWRWTELGDIGTFYSGGTPSKNNPEYWGGNIPFVTGADITDLYITREHARSFLTEKGLNSGKTAICQPRTILFVTRTGVGKVGIASDIMGVSQDLSPFVCSDMVYPEYVCRYLQSITGHLSDNSRGAIIQGLTRDFVRSLEIPLPSLEEQKRIAARLDEQMRHIEGARLAAEESLSAAWELPSAYLREVFEGTEAKKWQVQRLAEISEIISGITLGRKLGEVKTRKVPYLRVANVKDGHLDLSDIKEIDATDNDIKKCLLKYGDLLLTEGGDPDKLGRGTFWEEQIPECLHQNHIFRVRFDLNKFSPQFAAYQFGSAYGKDYFLAHAKQTTGIATINQKVLGNFPFLIPPFEEQKQIAKAIKTKIDEANVLIAHLETQLAEIESLPSAVLGQAFAGGV